MAASSGAQTAEARSTIVVGSGSAGGVVAARLAEDPEHEVILLEAGPHYATDRELPSDLLNPDVPSLAAHDWGFEAYLVEPATDRQPYHYPRGRLTGGSSSVNAASAGRGNSTDFDEWAAMGCPEWSWERVLPAFCSLERDLDYGQLPYHGSNGPLPILRHHRSEWGSLSRAFEQACQLRGFPICDDMNAPGSAGIGPIPRNKADGLRGSTARTFLRDALSRPNLKLHSNSTALRVAFEGTRAVAVDVQFEHGRELVRADRIVLCAGAFKTPQILILSGVGPPETLKALDIDPVSLLSGVGRNLIDHPAAPMVGLARKLDSTDRFRAILKYATDGASAPDVCVGLGMVALSSLHLDVSRVDGDDASAFVAFPYLGKPKSRGWLTVVSPDLAVAPEIHLNFLAESVDLQRLTSAAELAYELVTGSVMASQVISVVNPAAEIATDKQRLGDWVHASVATAYHAVGTCRMGAAADPAAVVTPRLAVRGTENLYVADASVMPDITAGWTNLPAFMVGERFVDLLSA